MPNFFVTQIFIHKSVGVSTVACHTTGMASENKRRIIAAMGISSLVAVSLLAIGLSYFPSQQSLEVNSNSSTQTSSSIIPTAVSSSSTTDTGIYTTPVPAAAVCSEMSTQSSPSASVFNVVINYTGHWSADISGYSDSAQAFVQCYNGTGLGFVSFSSWNPVGSESLSVTVQKTDGSNGNLTLRVNGDVNSTSAPYGSVTVLAGVQP